MLTQAAQEFDIDLKKSFIIGDRAMDVETAHNAGATPIMVLTGYGKTEAERIRQNNVPVMHIANDLYDAVQFVKQSLLETHS